MEPCDENQPKIDKKSQITKKMDKLSSEMFLKSGQGTLTLPKWARNRLPKCLPYCQSEDTNRNAFLSQKLHQRNRFYSKWFFFARTRLPGDRFYSVEAVLIKIFSLTLTVLEILSKKRKTMANFLLTLTQWLVSTFSSRLENLNRTTYLFYYSTRRYNLLHRVAHFHTRGKSILIHQCIK